MGIKSLAAFLKKEELGCCPEMRDQSSIHGRHHHPQGKTTTDDDLVMKDLFDSFIVDMDDDEEEEDQNMQEMESWECLIPKYEERNGCKMEEDSISWCMYLQEAVKKEEAEYIFCEEDDDEKKMSLNLSLNYQGVLDAWSDRTLWADDSSSSFSVPTTPTNPYPQVRKGSGAAAAAAATAEEERKQRVLRYKEKRQTRLFSKKIRYQVRKLNADKRPRLKGRFVKRVADQKMMMQR